MAKAISEALARSDAKYAIADRFDEAKGEYSGMKLAQLACQSGVNGNCFNHH